MPKNEELPDILAHFNACLVVHFFYSSIIFACDRGEIVAPTS